MEHPGPALKVVHAGLDAALFHHGALGGQIAVENGQAALRIFGRGQGEDDVVFHQLHVLQVLPQGLAGDGELSGVQLGLDGLQNSGDTSRLVQIAEGMLAGGLDVADVGHLPADLVEIVQGDGDARLMGDGRQMEGAVGGRAHGHAGGDAVAQALAGHDLPRRQILGNHLHDAAAGLLGDAPFLGRDGVGQAAAGQGHAQHLCQTAHGIGGAQHGAGAVAG